MRYHHLFTLYMKFYLHPRPFDFVKVTCTLIIRCILCCWMFIPKMKYVGSIEFEIWTFVWRKLKGRHHYPFNLYEIQLQICKGHIKAAYLILVWSDIRELRCTVGNLTEIYEETDILWLIFNLWSRSLLSFNYVVRFTSL